MKLRSSWREWSGRLEPTCETDTVFRDGDSLLSCLLMDTGGLPYGDLEMIAWFEEGQRRIRAVKLGEAESLTWGREDWGFAVSRDRAEIYSLHEEDHAELISVDALERALRAWIDFMQTPPGANATRTIVV